MDASNAHAQEKPSFKQVEALAITNPEALRLVLHPVRTRLLSELRLEARTVRELSRLLGLAPTKLYYHMKLLLKAGFVAVVGERKVGNLTETSYLAVARSFTAGNGVVGGDEAGITPTVASWAEVVKAEAGEAWRRREAWPDPPPICDSSFVFSLNQAWLTKEEADEFWSRLEGLVAEFEAIRRPPGSGDSPSLDRYELALGWFPCGATEPAGA